MADIRKRQSKTGETTYSARVRLKGFPTQSATFERLTDAKRWVQLTEAAIREGRHFKTNESKKRTLAELIDKYSEVLLPQRKRDKKTVEGELRWWKSKLGCYTLSDITPQLVADYRDKLAKEPVEFKDKPTRYRSAATIIRYLATLSVCFTYAVQELGWIDENPVLKVRKPKLSNARVRFLSDDERERLIEACKSSKCGYLLPIVIVALSTGARMGEILSLEWKDIDFNRRVMRLEETKNGEKRAIPLSSHVFEALESLRKVRRIDSKLLFPRADGKKPIEIKKYWQKAVLSAELEDFKFHDLRHTAASYLAMNGATLMDLSHILGHKQLKMVKRYAHLTEQHTAEVLERMNAKQFGEMN